MRKPPVDDTDEADLRVTRPKEWSAGIPGVRAALRNATEQMGVRRTALTLSAVNQKDGFDCPGCAWPEDSHRHRAEFCENGAKAVAEEATLRRVGPAFFSAHSVDDLAAHTDHWLGQQGRLTSPMLLREGSTHYQPVTWEEALGLVAAELRGLDSPDQAIFYTSGRTSNEAAFVYQLFVRSYGTNNLPDCSNLCHESSGTALTETIGVGKGSVTLEDIYAADLILVVGQNPGTNHPRMLTALERAKANGARIVAVNPLPEAGFLRFKNPQRASGVIGRGTALADLFLQLRVGGDLALFQAMGQLLVQREEKEPGTVLDRSFIDAHTQGFDAYAESLGALDWDDVIAASGLSRDQIEELADLYAAAHKVIVCWAMGLTQHKGAVATIREIVNVLLLRGNIGRPGAGVCPVRGHSNVQGDRTMGIYERPSATFLDALQREFGFDPPREPGFDVVDSIRAMRDGQAKVLFAVGGNFATATPDTEATHAALRTLRLTVQVSTKLNRSHLVTGRTALILPTLGRTERDTQRGGNQFVTVEDSMGLVHASRGALPPASDDLLSEVAIVCRLARLTLGHEHPVEWEHLVDDYSLIRDRVSRVVPGFEDYDARASDPDGFLLPHPPRDSRTFPTQSGRAEFTVNPLEVLRVPPGRLLLQTIRSHDQYNTTIYGLDDRYRGVHGGRRVVLVSRADLQRLGITDGELVDLVSEWPDDVDRVAEAFRVVEYPTAAGCAAAYFPETNRLVPLDSTARGSNTPTYKSIVVRLRPRAAATPRS